MMPRESIFQALQTHNALVDVSLDNMATIQPTDSQHAARAKLLRGEHCFILMGTTAGSAISMARIAAVRPNNLEWVKGQPTRISAEVDYMMPVRRVLGAYLKKPELFQAPIAWLFSSDPSSVSSTFIRQGISVALQHLCIELRIGREPGFYEPSPSSLVPEYGCTVVAVHHPMGLSEVYVGQRLAYPKACSGALAFAKGSLCS